MSEVKVFGGARRVLSARVAQKNTPETDAMPQVMHIVSGFYEIGGDWEVRLMAEEPGAAIDKVQSMKDEDLVRLIGGTMVTADA